MTAANLLLRITQESGGAESGLRRLERELADFARQTAEATADVDTADGRAKLEELQRELGEIDRRRVSPEVNVAIAQAVGRLQTLKARLDAIDRQDVTVNARVRQQVVNEINTVSRSVDRLRASARQADIDIDAAGRSLDRTAARGSFLGRVFGAMAGAVSAVGDVFVSAGGETVSFGAKISTLGRMIPLLAAGVVALSGALSGAVSGLGAVVLSGAAAVAGLGALGLAFGGVGAAAVAFGGAVAGAMKQGTAEARAVKGAVKGLKQDFATATGAGVKFFLQDLAPAIKSIGPAVRNLKLPFAVFGQAAGAAVRGVAGHVKGALIPAFGELVNRASDALGPIAQAAVHLGEILLNIANAAMPALIGVLKEVASTFKGWAEATRNSTALRNVIETLVYHFKLWWGILKDVGSFLVSTFRAGEPAIRKFVEWLARGAKRLAEWASSREGQQQIRRFFEDTLPAVQRVVEAIAKILPAILKLGQAVAPVLGPIISLFGTVLKGAIDDVRQSIEWLKAPFVALGPFLTGIWNGIKSGATAAWSAIKTAASSAAGPVKTAWGAVKPHLATVWEGIKTAASSAWGFIKRAATNPAGAVKTAWNGVKTGVSTAWRGLKGLATTVWGGIKTAVVGASRGAGSLAKGAWNTAKAGISAAWRGLKTAAGTVWRGIKTTVGGAARGAVSVAKSAWNNGKAAITAVWNRLKSAASSVWKGIKAAVSTAAKGAVGAAKTAWNTGKRALSRIWSDLKSAASRTWRDIKGGVKTFTRDAANIISGSARDFERAGGAIMGAVGAGIRRACSEVAGTLRHCLAQLRSLLSGSEPKDPTSPLRGLAKAGIATMRTYAAGIRRGTPAVLRAMRDMARAQAGEFPTRGRAAASLQGRIVATRARRRRATGDARERLAERLAGLRAELEQVGRLRLARTGQLSAAVANMVPTLGDSIVRVPTVPTARPAAAAVGGPVTNNIYVTSPAGAMPDAEWVAAKLDEKIRNRGGLS